MLRPLQRLELAIKKKLHPIVGPKELSALAVTSQPIPSDVASGNKNSSLRAIDPDKGFIVALI